MKISILFLAIFFLLHRNAVSQDVEDEGFDVGGLPPVKDSIIHSLEKDYIDKIIDEVNNNEDSTWVAGHNFDGVYDNLHHLVGSVEMDPEAEQQLGAEDVPACGGLSIDGVPHHNNNKGSDSDESEIEDDDEIFDAREKWKNCPSIGKVLNQGKCASDWVLSPLSVITDRICITSNGTKKVSLSAHDPLSCCKTCGWGCKKGYAQMVFKKFVQNGLATGGEYGSNQGCQPYEVPPCDNYKTCFAGNKGVTPACKPYCYNKEYGDKYAQDLIKGKSWFRVQCCCAAISEIEENGPLTSTMTLYEDFLTYKSGVYKHVTGKKIGMLTVKIIGYNDRVRPRYYIGVNSWGEKWGDKGTFKIVRKEYECQIDSPMFGVRLIDDKH